MRLKNRRRVNWLANTIEDASERFVGWLRAKAERKHRPRPLVFPSPLWVALQEVQARMVQKQVARFVADFTETNRFVRALNHDEGVPFVPINARWNEDADA